VLGHPLDLLGIIVKRIDIWTRITMGHGSAMASPKLSENQISVSFSVKRRHHVRRKPITAQAALPLELWSCFFQPRLKEHPLVNQQRLPG